MDWQGQIPSRRADSDRLSQNTRRTMETMVTRLKTASDALDAYPTILDAAHNADEYNALLDEFMDAQHAVIMASWVK